MAGVSMRDELSKLWTTEDYWAVWLGLGIVLLALAMFSTGGTIAGWAVKPGGWSSLGQLTADLGSHAAGYLVIFLVFGVVFTLSMVAMGRNVGQFVPGFIPSRLYVTTFSESRANRIVVKRRRAIRKEIVRIVVFTTG